MKTCPSPQCRHSGSGLLGLFLSQSGISPKDRAYVAPIIGCEVALQTLGSTPGSPLTHTWTIRISEHHSPRSSESQSFTYGSGTQNSKTCPSPQCRHSGSGLLGLFLSQSGISPKDRAYVAPIIGCEQSSGVSFPCKHSGASLDLP